MLVGSKRKFDKTGGRDSRSAIDEGPHVCLPDSKPNGKRLAIVSASKSKHLLVEGKRVLQSVTTDQEMWTSLDEFRSRDAVARLGPHVSVKSNDSDVVSTKDDSKHDFKKASDGKSKKGNSKKGKSKGNAKAKPESKSNPKKKSPKITILDLNSVEGQPLRLPNVMTKQICLKPFRALQKLLSQCSRLEWQLPLDAREPLQCQLYQGTGSDERLVATVVNA